jgi:hypothetical protein
VSGRHEAEEHRTVDNARFCRDMLHFDARRTEHVLYLMRNKPWDFLGFVMKSTDTLQHEIFQYLDPTHPRYNAAEAARVMPAIREFYAGLDACVGKLVEAAGPDVTVVLMSDHGFGPFHKFFHTNNWLHRLGLLQFKRGPLSLAKRAIFRAGATPVNVMKFPKCSTSTSCAARETRARARPAAPRLPSFDDVDWTRTQAFSIGNFGQIYLNVRAAARRASSRPAPSTGAARTHHPRRARPARPGRRRPRDRRGLPARGDLSRRAPRQRARHRPAPIAPSTSVRPRRRRLQPRDRAERQARPATTPWTASSCCTGRASRPAAR